MATETDLRNVLREWADAAIGSPNKPQIAAHDDPAEMRSPTTYVLDRSTATRLGRTGGRPTRRRHAALAGAAAAAAASLAIVIAVTTRQNHRSEADVASPRHAPSSSRTSTSPPTRRTLATATPEWIAHNVGRFLPPNGTISDLTGNSDHTTAGALFDYDDGHGTAGIEVTIRYPATTGGQRYEAYCDPDEIAGDNPAPRCTGITGAGPAPQCLEPGVSPAPCGKLPAGSQVYEDSTDEARTIPGWQPHPGAPDGWTVAVLQPNGVDVEIDLQNGPNNPKYTITRTKQLISEQQMLTIASDPSWNYTTPSSDHRHH